MVGDNIKRLRTKHKDSQEYLSQKLSISINYLSQIENNKKTPSFKLLDKMAKHYNCSIASIVEENKLKSELKQLIDQEGMETVLKTLNELIES